MKNVFTVLLAFGAMTCAFAELITIKGQGGYTSGDPLLHGDNQTAAFILDIKKENGRMSGTMLFAAEGESGPYPQFIVRLSHVHKISVGEGWAEVHAHGTLNGVACKVHVKVYDFSARNKGDMFHMHCEDNMGVKLFHTEGWLKTGDVAVTHQK